MNSNTSQPELAAHGRILVADDEPRNMELLRDMLEAEGHSVIEAENGVVVLEKVKSEVIDVILLDVMMPQMDGLEACRQLKQNSKTSHIPVLIVSALSNKEQRLQGIDAGANDYLTKPIDRRDVILRVRNALYAKRLYDQVQEDLAKLRELEILRDNLTNMVVHDMRSPLTGILGYMELLEKYAGEKLNTKELTLLKNGRKSGVTLLNMINSLLDVSRLEQGQMPLNLTESNIDILIQNAVNSLGSLTEDISLRHLKQNLPATVKCDEAIVTRIIANLVGNAAKFAPKESTVTISVECNEDEAKLCVRDTGKGIPAEYHQKIFEKFGQVEVRQDKKMFSTGLGLAFCKLAVEAHDGQIGVISEVGKGSTFWFTIPRTD